MVFVPSEIACLSFFSYSSHSRDYKLLVVRLKKLEQLDDLGFLEILLQLLGIGGKSDHSICVSILVFSF